MKIDKLASDHFDSADDFGRAMQLLFESIAAQRTGQSFEDYEESFLTDLEDIDEWLLTKAESFNQQIFSEFKKLKEEIEILREAIRNQTASGSIKDQDAFLAKIQAVVKPPLSDDENPMLEDLFEQWQNNNRNNLVESSFRNAYIPAIELFIRFVNDYQGGSVRVNDLRPEHIRYYQKYYPKIPKRVVPSKYSISKLIQLTGDSKLPKTITDNFSNIATFLNWIGAKGFPIDHQLSNILTKGSDIRPSAKQAKQRVPFDDKDLKRLFNSESYTSTGNFKTSAMYWAPLLALFTGARMGEILQLEAHDVEKHGNTWVINFTDLDLRSTDSKKRLKQHGSRRVTPVHKQLVTLKFIDYVKTCDNRLFPDEPRNKNSKFDAFQKRHTYYRKQLGVAPKHDMEMKDFHSFRHTVRTRLAELRTAGHVAQRFDEGIIDAIIGHASKGRSIGETTYNHTQYINVKKKAIDRLTYKSIDFKRLLRWDKCEFARRPFREKVRRKHK